MRLRRFLLDICSPAVVNALSANQVLSYGVPTYEIPNVYPYPVSWGGLSQTQKDAFVRSFVVRSKVWGVPYTLQTHPDSESLVDFSGIVSALAKTQGFAKTLTQMGTYLRGLDRQRTTTSYSGPATGILDMTPTSSSPTINAGVAVGLTTDILGNPITGIPDIGAYKYQGVTNTPPVVTITSPTNGSTFSYNSVINFSGTATDTQSGDLSSIIAWSSNIDGNLGIGSSLSRVLSPGTHTITASVTDLGGLIGTATITLTVNNNTPPVVTINSPANGSTFPAGTAILFMGTATDTESGNLTASLTWTSSIDGSIGSGGSFSKTLSSGTHTITASVTDPGGLIGRATVNITVGQSNTPPVVTIVSPTNGATFASVAVINFSGTATDTESGNLTASLTWTSSLDGPIGSGGSFSRTLSSGTHTITASVTDPGGLIGTKTVNITVADTPPGVAEFGYHPSAPSSLSLAYWSKGYLSTQTTAVSANPASSGTLTSISLWCKQYSGASTLHVAIYADNAGSPGALLAQDAGGTAIGSSEGWVTVPITCAISANTPYWLSYYGSNGLYVRYTSAAGLSKFDTSHIGIWQNPFYVTQSDPSQVGLYATYNTGSDPPPVVPEFGYHPSAPSSLSLAYWSQGYLSAQTTAVSANPASSGTLTSISLWCKQYSGASTLHVAIYADNAGSPGALLAQDAGGTAVGSSEGWVTVPITCAISANTPYWLAYYGSNGVYVRYTSAAGLSKFDTSHLGIWQNPFHVTQSDPSQVGLYATYNQN